MCPTPNGNLHTRNTQSSILDLIGEWGAWQRRTVFLIFLCKIPAAWFMACIIFTAPFAKYGEYFCKQPDTGLPLANQTEWIHIAHPLSENNEFDFCEVYENRNEALFDWQQQQTIVGKFAATEKCNSFEHHSIFSSLVTQFDLVCSRTIWIAVTQFFHLCGVLSGGILATQLLDLYGQLVCINFEFICAQFLSIDFFLTHIFTFSLSPRNVMLVGMITQIISGCLTGLVNNFGLHILFRYLAAVCCALMYTPGLMICRCHLLFILSLSVFRQQKKTCIFPLSTKLVFYVGVTDQQKMLLVCPSYRRQQSYLILKFIRQVSHIFTFWTFAFCCVAEIKTVFFIKKF